MKVALLEGVDFSFKRLESGFLLMWMKKLLGKIFIRLKPKYKRSWAIYVSMDSKNVSNLKLLCFTHNIRGD
jgi:hypothetical protein